MTRYLLIVLIMLNLGVWMATSCTSIENKAEKEVAEYAAEEAASEKDGKMFCKYGGPGASACEIPAGIDINGETSFSCSVTCIEGYYACCGIGCKCLPVE